MTPSYPDIKRGGRLMCQYTIHSHDQKENTIPSHFSKGWTMGALDNDNFADTSSVSGTKVKNYTAQVLYQDASVPPNSKPTVSSFRS